MTAVLTADHEGQSFPVDLTRVSALDALVYRQACGEDLDVRIGALLAAAPGQASDWRLADRAILAWLYVRQNVDPDALLAPVAASMTLLPATEPVAGIDAPEVK